MQKMKDQTDIDILRLAAFSDGEVGGNPAGVVVADALPARSEMQRIAALVGYSETVFAAPEGDGWQVRYFSPEDEVAFCGHATIALGSVLAERAGDGIFLLDLASSRITVEVRREAGKTRATLTSPPTRSAAADPALVRSALDLFGLAPDSLDPALPAALAHAGNDHLILALKDKATLAGMSYELAEGAVLMRQHGLTTIDLLWIATPRTFHSRNAFAIGGVLEDPATGAAAAALGGYLRDIGWPHEGAIDIVQGVDMGVPSVLRAKIDETRGAGIRVSGTTRVISA